MPYFSICIPTYNRKKYLKRCLNHLEEQTFKDFEVIIVDDGSVDGTGDYVEYYRNKSMMNLNYIYKDNGGKYTAMNKGILAANGKYFIVLDSDDYLSNDALKIMHKMAKDNKEKYGVIGKTSDAKGLVIGNKFRKDDSLISYINFHFEGRKFGDCCECNLTYLMKENLFPEFYDTKFIPESYIYNQIGLKSKMVTTNKILEIVAYLPGGITDSYSNGFEEKNYLGYLLDYVNDINIIFKEKKVGIKYRLIIWLKYWNLKRYDVKNSAPKIQNISFLGMFARLIYRFVFKIKNKGSI